MTLDSPGLHAYSHSLPKAAVAVIPLVASDAVTNINSVLLVIEATLCLNGAKVSSVDTIISPTRICTLKNVLVPVTTFVPPVFSIVPNTCVDFSSNADLTRHDTSVPAFTTVTVETPGV